MQTKLDPKQTCILIDFDKTITLGKVKGVGVPSIISILRSENHLSERYSKAAYALEAKYKPIEADHNLSFEMRYKAMESWWDEHLDLLIESGLNFEHIKRAAQSKQIVIRNGFTKIVDFANKNNIPVIIFSASGIGYEPIDLVLKRENIMSDNITIISNRFIWNKDGKAMERVLPTVHSLSKTGSMLKNTEAWSKIRDKKFCVLVGDALHDLRMSEGIDFEKVISFGVLNDIDEKNLDLYHNHFDYVIKGDEKNNESLSKILEIFI